MVSTNTYQAQANELSQKLWAIANELRGQMDASEFKNYILGVIFYRYLSERTEMYMAEILENDGMTYEEAMQEAARCLRCDYYGFGAFRGGRKTKW